MVELIVFIFIAGLITGLVGLLLGVLIDKAAAGFFLGAFLGPIGWIIVFLLPRESKKSVSQAAQTPKDTDLSSESYRLYLGNKYEIKRNELFQQFECKEKLFETLEDALAFADEIDKRQIKEKITEKRTEKRLTIIIIGLSILFTILIIPTALFIMVNW